MGLLGLEPSCSEDRRFTVSIGDLTVNIPMKTCSICKQKKSAKMFYPNPITKDGLGSQCKVCDADGKRWRRRERKRRLVEALGGKCSKCGYSKSLAAFDFHHPNDDKEASVSELLARKGNFERALSEAKKCMLLCANCHRETHEMDVTERPSKSTWVHGTIKGYRRCVGKCKPCLQAWAAYMKKLRLRNPTGLHPRTNGGDGVDTQGTGEGRNAR